MKKSSSLWGGNDSNTNSDSDSDSSDSATEGRSPNANRKPSLRRLMKDMDYEDTVREISAHAEPHNSTLARLHGWAEEFNDRREQNGTLRRKIMSHKKKSRQSKYRIQK